MIDQDANLKRIEAAKKVLGKRQSSKDTTKKLESHFQKDPEPDNSDNDEDAVKESELEEHDGSGDEDLTKKKSRKETNTKFQIEKRRKVKEERKRQQLNVYRRKIEKIIKGSKEFSDEGDREIHFSIWQDGWDSLP